MRLISFLKWNKHQPVCKWNRLSLLLRAGIVVERQKQKQAVRRTLGFNELDGDLSDLI